MYLYLLAKAIPGVKKHFWLMFEGHPPITCGRLDSIFYVSFQMMRVGS